MWLIWRAWERRRPATRFEPEDNERWSSGLTPWDISFLRWVGLTPVIATLLVSTLLGTRLVAAWGTTFFMLWGFYMLWVIRGEERVSQNPEPVFTKAGRPATRGTCPKCGTTVYRMGATPAHEGMSPEAGKGK